MATFISNSPAETEQLGEEWAKSARPGLVVAISGDLGAGKTQLVRGFARGLGSKARVHSPTFALLHIYDDGRVPLFHLDLYRLDSPEQVVAAGLEEYFRPRGITVVEWAERWFGGEPGVSNKSAEGPGQDAAPKTLKVRKVFVESIGETKRRITYEDSGD